MLRAIVDLRGQLGWVQGQLALRGHKGLRVIGDPLAIEDLEEDQGSRGRWVRPVGMVSQECQVRQSPCSALSPSLPLWLLSPSLSPSYHRYRKGGCMTVPVWLICVICAIVGVLVYAVFFQH